MTDTIAAAAADRAGASLYAVRQPPDLRWHIPSAEFDPRHSPALAAFLDHVEVAIAVHGYGRPDRFTTLLLGGNLKQPGRLTIQLRGNGPVSLLVIDCNEQLQIRGMARCEAQPESKSLRELLGHGHLQLSLDMRSMREPYQSIVPLDGENVAEVFEHYLRQSDQLPTVFSGTIRGSCRPPSAEASRCRSVRPGWLPRHDREGLGSRRQRQTCCCGFSRRGRSPFPARTVILALRTGKSALNAIAARRGLCRAGHDEVVIGMTCIVTTVLMRRPYEVRDFVSANPISDRCRKPMAT
jgi:hypothetical protein